MLMSVRGIFSFPKCPWRVLLLKNILDSVVGNHLFLEGVGTGLRRLNDLDDLAIGAAFSLLESCNGFLCHESVRLFNFLVYGDFLEDGVVFLQLQTLGSVLAVLGGDIALRSGHSAGLVFGAFEDHLYAIAFSFLCHLYVRIECI